MNVIVESTLKDGKKAKARAALMRFVFFVVP